MSEIRLTCVSTDSAAAVAAEATRPGDQAHTLKHDGAQVVITYTDHQFPIDVAMWAFHNGHAYGGGAARLMLDVQGIPDVQPNDHREALIRGLRDMADWLDNNPQVPVGDSTLVRLQFSPTAYIPDYDGARAEVLRVAELIGTEPDEPKAGRIIVRRSFGPVSYVAAAHDRKASDHE